MSQAADAEELVDLADASILVVRQHTALVKDINETISILNSAEGTMLGCVYNDVFHGVAQTARNYGYKYAYGSGYGYGSKYGYGTMDMVTVTVTAMAMVMEAERKRAMKIKHRNQKQNGR